jgi:hypothetical protein
MSAGGAALISSSIKRMASWAPWSWIGRFVTLSSYQRTDKKSSADSLGLSVLQTIWRSSLSAIWGWSGGCDRRLVGYVTMRIHVEVLSRRHGVAPAGGVIDRECPRLSRFYIEVETRKYWVRKLP